MALIDQYTKEELTQIVKQSNSLAEVIRKLGYTTTGGSNSHTVKTRLKEYSIDISHFSNNQNIVRNESNVFIKDSTASQATLRRWYLKGKYTPYNCSICGQGPIWQDKPLTLILDHINGINNDDRLENLRWVCPNCNQQLDTTGFKKMRTETPLEKSYYCSECGAKITAHSQSGLCLKCASKKRRVCEHPSRDKLKFLIRNFNFKEIGRKYGVNDNAIRKWCDAYNLPRRVADIKQYSDEEWESI